MLTFKMDEFVATVPAVYQEIYRRHWNTIKTSVKKGAIRDVYHFPLVNYSQQEIISHLTTIRAATRRFKINVTFGFILKDKATEELRFFHPSNNTLLFETPMLITNGNDFTDLLERVERQDVLEYARHQRPSTKWTVEQIICVRFDVYRLSNADS